MNATKIRRIASQLDASDRALLSEIAAADLQIEEIAGDPGAQLLSQLSLIRRSGACAIATRRGRQMLALWAFDQREAARAAS